MSAQIRQERKEYYDLLEDMQKGETDITEWLTWFLECLGRAIDGAETLLASILTKARFWESIGASPLNERQRLVLNKLLDGFEGKLTSSKWAKLTKSSQDTAQRDITDQVQRGILVRSEERQEHELQTDIGSQLNVKSEKLFDRLTAGRFRVIRPLRPLLQLRSRFPPRPALATR
jgi:Fic family protein